MQTIRTHKDLIVWNKAMDFVIEVYRYTENLPRYELYGLTSQMRRAAISIPSNIAEGARRRHKRERRQFFIIAFSSGAELETQLDLAYRIFPKINHDTFKLNGALIEIMKMLNSLINRY